MVKSKALYEEVIDEIGTQTLARFGLNIFSLNTYGAYGASVTATNNILTSYKINKNNSNYFGFIHEEIEVGRKNIDSALYNKGEISFTTDELAYINKEFYSQFQNSDNEKIKSDLINQNYTKAEIKKMARKYSNYTKENNTLVDVVTFNEKDELIKEEQHKVIKDTKGEKGLYGKNNKYLREENLKIVVANDDYLKHKNELEKTIQHSKNIDDVNAAKKTLEKLEQSRTTRKEAMNPTLTSVKMQGTQAGFHIAQAGMSDAIVVSLSMLANGAIFEIKDAFSEKGSNTPIEERIKRLIKKVFEAFKEPFKRGASFGAVDVGIGILTQIFKTISSKLKYIWKELRTSLKSVFNAIWDFITGKVKSYQELISVIIKAIFSAIMVAFAITLETKLELWLAPLVSPIVAKFLAPTLAIIVSAIAVIIFTKSIDLALNTLFGAFTQRDIAKMKAEEIKALCEEMLPTLIEDRKELEKLIETTYKERKLTFEKSFEDFKEGITANDVESVIFGLQNINSMYGKSLKFQTFDEFDEFMLNSNSVIKL
jgi:hypothetical protein